MEIRDAREDRVRHGSQSPLLVSQASSVCHSSPADRGRCPVDAMRVDQQTPRREDRPEPPGDLHAQHTATSLRRMLTFDFDGLDLA